jgi:hypothetical protein
MYISRDEALCIPASEFLISYEFHILWSAWSEGSMLYSWYRGNFQKYSFSHPGAGIQNIFRDLRTSKDVIRVVEHVRKISRAQRTTLRLPGRVKWDCHQTSLDLGSKYPLKPEFSMNW